MSYACRMRGFLYDYLSQLIFKTDENELFSIWNMGQIFGTAGMCDWFA